MDCRGGEAKWRLLVIRGAVLYHAMGGRTLPGREGVQNVQEGPLQTWYGRTWFELIFPVCFDCQTLCHVLNQSKYTPPLIFYTLCNYVVGKGSPQQKAVI